MLALSGDRGGISRRDNGSVEGVGVALVATESRLAARPTLCVYPWPRGCAWAVAVVDCESDFNASADSNWPYIGWWQIDVNHLNAGAALDGFGWTVADLYDPAINTAAAWELYRLQGVGAWPWCGR